MLGASEVGTGTTRDEIVVAASFRTWPGWRQPRPPGSRGAYGRWAAV